MPSRHLILRSATSALHRQLDACFGDLVTLGDYTRYVTTVATLRSTIEPQVRARSRELAGYLPTCIANALCRDCLDLGLADTSSLRPSSPVLRGDAWIGAAYVIEGSIVGAVMVERSARRLGLGPEHGARHLQTLVENRANWPAFLSALERASNINMDEAVEGAIASFSVALSVARDLAYVA